MGFSPTGLDGSGCRLLLILLHCRQPSGVPFPQRTSTSAHREHSPGRGPFRAFRALFAHFPRGKKSKISAGFDPFRAFRAPMKGLFSFFFFFSSSIGAKSAISTKSPQPRRNAGLRLR
jgi:hypothetical protein